MDSLIEEILKPLILNDNQVREVGRKMCVQMIKGLNSDTLSQSSLKMVPTYVRKLPTGKEVGKFLALDLGGTNFRVLLITLDGKSDGSKLESKIYAIPEEFMLGTGQALFDHIADCLKAFLEVQNLQDEILPLGFTFSFPCSQDGLRSARLIHWTKGFKSSGVEGEDIVLLLEKALQRKGITNIEMTAVLNDTTGTLMSCAFECPTCEIGLILGTGTNACYMERLENVGKWDGDQKPPNQVIINVEWGAFGDKNELDFILTEYDIEIDAQSINPGQQHFEKMISGMYLGELVRLVLVKLIDQKLIFDGIDSFALNEKQRFYTRYVSSIEADTPCTCANTDKTLKELGIDNATIKDCKIVKRVCEVVSQRAAHLASAGVATLINKIAKTFVTVAVDGSLYRFHPHFRSLMVAKIQQLVYPDTRFDLMLSEDGSGRGAALVAAVAASNSS